MSPWSTRPPPNQRIATVETFMTSMTVGNMSAMSLPVLSETSSRFAFATAYLACSKLSRTNARITRMPVICSRMTPLTSSIRVCI